MQCICLGYLDETPWDERSASERRAFMEEGLASDDALRRGGHLLGGEALQSVRTATTLRWQNGKVTVTDSPDAETKEQLAGLSFIEARDLNDAIQIASQIPLARVGRIEVRPIWESRQREPRQAEAPKGDIIMAKNKLALPNVVSRDEWLVARQALLTKEKALTRARDALHAERRRLPMVQIEKAYVFAGSDGPASLLALFAGRRQLIVYHFMFDPDWDEGCDGCAMLVDNMGHPAHLHARDTSRVLVSRAPLEQLERFKQRMGWTIPWYSSFGSDFNADFGVTTDAGESFGLSVFLREDDNIFHTYFTDGRGVEYLGSNWSYLDLTPRGRQEDWEDSPDGWPQTPPYGWWRHHDRYGDLRRDADACCHAAAEGNRR